MYFTMKQAQLDSTPDIFLYESSTVKTVYLIYFTMIQAQFRQYVLYIQL